MNAVVLSGGGARGSYQVGVWKALKEQKFKYEIVTGTSVGSINGALMVTSSYRKARKIWKDLDFNKIFDNIKSSKDLVKNSFDGGIEPIKLEKLIRDNLNIRKFYKSKIKYGLVTVKFPKMKPVFLKKEDIPENRIVDYLIASSTCFPVFSMKKIDDQLYIDGAYHDNIPINLAIEMGATKIIAVDLKALGLKVKPKKQVDITYISPKKKLGSFIDFGRKYNEINMKYGYNDTLKALGKIEGNIYFFKNKTIEKINKKLGDRLYKDLINILDMKKKGPISEFFKNTLYKDIISSKKIKDSRIQEILELIASLYELDETVIYSQTKLNWIIKAKLKKI